MDHGYSAVQKWTGVVAGLVGASYGSFSILALSDQRFEIHPILNRVAVIIIIVLSVGWVVLAAADAANRRSADRDMRYVVATEVERRVAILERAIDQAMDEKLRDLREAIDRDAAARSTEDTDEIRVTLLRHRIEMEKTVRAMLDDAAAQVRAGQEQILRALMISDSQPQPVANGRNRAQVHRLPNGN